MFKQIKLWGVVAVAALAVSTFAATTAQAQTSSVQTLDGVYGPTKVYVTYTYAADKPSFVGWARVQDESRPTSSYVTAYYQGANHSWRTFSLKRDEWVYVERYANGWDWAYSYTYKYWFVMPTNDILVSEQHQTYNDCSTPTTYACKVTGAPVSAAR